MSHFAGRWIYLAVAAAVAGCSTRRSLPDGAAPVPPIAAGIPTAATGPWSFAHAVGTRAYRISRTASVQGIVDSAARRELVSNFTHQILAVERADNNLSFTAVVDTFALTTQGAVGASQPVELPFQLSGILGPSGIRIQGGVDSACSAPQATVITDLHNLLVPFPATLVKGAAWRDSIIVSACHAGIPTTTVNRRSFTVLQQVLLSGHPYLVVDRVDSSTAHGEGAYGQHRMLVDGSGVGTARYHLDTTTGEVFRLTTSQTSQIRVTTSGRVHSFTQSLNQEFARAP